MPIINTNLEPVGTGFILSAIAKAEIAQIIIIIIASQQPPPPQPASLNNVVSDNKWKAEELGFFDPYLTSSLGLGDVVTVGKELYYRSVILFIDRIADLVTVKPAALVRANINICLRKAALSWYILELNDAKRSDLRNNTDDVILWIKNLKRRFKVLIIVAL